MELKTTGNKKIEQYLNKLQERREIQTMHNYNPFGRGGSGAPLRDENGNLLPKKAFNNDTYSNNSYNVFNKRVENLENNSFNYNNQNKFQQKLVNNNPIIKGYDENYPRKEENGNNFNYENQNKNFFNNLNSNGNNNENYMKDINNLNGKILANEQNLNNIMSNYNYPINQNYNKNNNYGQRTLSANRILEQNKNIYSDNIINDINKVYQESSKIDNFPLNNYNNINFNKNNTNFQGWLIKFKLKLIFRNIFFLWSYKFFLENQENSNANIQQGYKITNYFTIEENQNNFKRKQEYKDELSKQIEDKKREKLEKIKKESELDRLEEENYRIYL